MRRIWMVLGALALVTLALGGWAVWTVHSAEQHLQAARSNVLDARTALLAQDPGTADSALESANAESAAAAELAHRWVWSAATAIPLLGDTAEAARLLVLAADDAVTGVAGISDALGGLDPRALVADDGGVDLKALARVGKAAETAQEPLELARSRLAGMPSAAGGAWVLGPVEDARKDLTDQIAELSTGVDALAEVGRLGPGLLGADGPRRYFMAVQAPNETRGTGGLVGNWALVQADQGRLTVSEVGSNSDMPELDAVPRELGKEYFARYGPDPQLFVNMNVSPDLPSAAALWLASWKKKTGDPLDGVLTVDVTAIGALLSAAGVTLSAPDGLELSGAQFADFTLSGVYEKFPTSGDSTRRKAYQEALAADALAAVLKFPNIIGLGRAAVEQVEDRRIGVWVRDPQVQELIAPTALGHALAPSQPHVVEPAIINIGWSKLDTYLDRDFTYDVGRCSTGAGIARSELTMRLTSDIPEGASLPDYVLGTVRRTAAGPVNRVLLQAHLPTDADVIDVFVDGDSSGYTPFSEAGRPAVLMALDLPPRTTREVRIVFNEPTSGKPGDVLVQPMARNAVVSVQDRPC